MKKIILIILLKISSAILHIVTLGIPKLIMLINNKITKIENSNQGE